MISIHIKFTVCLFVCLLKPVSGFVVLEIISIYSNHHIWGLREGVKKKKWNFPLRWGRGGRGSAPDLQQNGKNKLELGWGQP